MHGICPLDRVPGVQGNGKERVGRVWCSGGATSNGPGDEGLKMGWMEGAFGVKWGEGSWRMWSLGELTSWCDHQTCLIPDHYQRSPDTTCLSSWTMGSSISTAEPDGNARSDVIDRQIKEGHMKYMREFKILVLGSFMGNSSILHLISSRPRRLQENDDNQTDEDRLSRRLHWWRTRPI